MPQKLSFTHGESAAPAPGELPPLGVAIPSVEAAQAEEGRRRAAAVQADLVVDALAREWGTVPTATAAWKKAFAEALVRNRTVPVYVHTSRGPRIVEVPEAEKMIRDHLRLWPRPAPPAFDPDGWISPPDASTIKDIAGILDELDLAGKLKEGIPRKEAILRFHKERKKALNRGFYLNDETLAGRAGLLK